MALYFTDGALFADIPDFPGYIISDYGEVFSILVAGNPQKRPENYKHKKKTLDGRRRYQVRLYQNKKLKCRLVHRLVLEAFVGPCPPGMECCHKDGNSLNNKLENLRWDTKLKNWEDRKSHGRYGYHYFKKKLDENQVREILTRLDNGESQYKLGIEFGVSEVMIHNLKFGKTWKRLQTKINRIIPVVKK